MFLFTNLTKKSTPKLANFNLKIFQHPITQNIHFYYLDFHLKISSYLCSNHFYFLIFIPNNLLLDFSTTTIMSPLPRSSFTPGDTVSPYFLGFTPIVTALTISTAFDLVLWFFQFNFLDSLHIITDSSVCSFNWFLLLFSYAQHTFCRQI